LQFVRTQRRITLSKELRRTEEICAQRLWDLNLLEGSDFTLHDDEIVFRVRPDGNFTDIEDLNKEYVLAVTRTLELGATAMGSAFPTDEMLATVIADRASNLNSSRCNRTLSSAENLTAFLERVVSVWRKDTHENEKLLDKINCLLELTTELANFLAFLSSIHEISVFVPKPLQIVEDVPHN